MKVLITGISGNLARAVAMELLARGHKVFGVDRRPWPDAPKGVQMFEADIRKRPAEDVFRTRRPDAVIHMVTVTHLTASTEERYRINLHGTKAIFEHCHTYKVKQAFLWGGIRYMVPLRIPRFTIRNPILRLQRPLIPLYPIWWQQICMRGLLYGNGRK